MMLSPAEYGASALGVSTPKQRKVNRLLQAANDHAANLIDEFKQRRDTGKLDEYEKRSYLMSTLGDQEASAVSFQDFKELCQVTLHAGDGGQGGGKGLEGRVGE